MDASASQLQFQLNSLRFHIDEAILRNAVVELDTSQWGEGARPLADYQQFYKRQRTQYAVLEYSARIVGLYGAFESFIEGTIMDYLSQLNAIVPKFENLPEKLREGHTQASAQLLQNRTHQKYSTIDERGVIENMLLCASRATPYRLNVAAYTRHTADFRVDSINDFFSNIGVFGIVSSVRDDMEFNEFLRSTYPVGAQVEKLPLPAVFSPLEEVADRRNEIAHGAPSELIAPDILASWIDFVDQFGRAVVRVLRQELLAAESSHRAIPLPRPLAVHDNRIVCFHVDKLKLAVGDRIIAMSGDGRWIDGHVETLEVEHRRLTTLEAPPAVAFAAGISSRVKDTFSFFYVPQPPLR